jgi:glycosyltransferase involved in cell wall biosynthesis
MISEIAGAGPNNLPHATVSPDAIHAFAITWPRSYAYAPAYASWLAANITRFDGVVLHGMWLYPHWQTATACRENRIPYVCCPHGMLEPWAVRSAGAVKALKKLAYWCWRERKVLGNARRIIYMTHREEAEAHKLPVVRTLASSVLPIPIDGFWASGRSEKRREKFCLFLGRVHPHKNLDFLLRSWAQARCRDQWKLIIAGPAEPGYDKRLQHLAGRLGIHDQVQFTGFVDGAEKRYFLENASWFVMPSVHENFGVAVAEAIHNGCAAVVSDQVYLSDYLSARSEVLPLDEDAWADFFLNRMRDDEWRRMLVVRNRRDLHAQCGPGATERWVDTFREIFLSRSGVSEKCGVRPAVAPRKDAEKPAIRVL